MAASDDLDPTLLARYLGGTALPADVEHLRQWVGDDLVRRNQLAALGWAWAHVGEVSAAAGPTPDVSSAWARLAAGAASAAHTARSASVRVPHRRPRGAGGGVWWRLQTNPAVRARAARPRSLIAAMIVIAVGIGLVVRSLQRRASVASPSRTYATAAGQRLSVTLVDGTQFTLAPASNVRVAADYGAGRELALEGEALFTVRHDDAHPFRVMAANAVTDDIGTRFVVRAYTGENAVRIAVTEGRVSLTRRGGAEGAEPLGARDLATVTDKGIAVTHHANLAALVAWTQGRLVFDRTPFRDAVQDLARTFDMDITVSDSTLLDQRVTGAFGDDERVDDVLTAVAVSVGAHVERSGRRVAIRRGAGGLTHTELLGSPPILRTARAEVLHE